jgi:hypothetical protein
VPEYYPMAYTYKALVSIWLTVLGLVTVAVFGMVVGA